MNLLEQEISNRLDLIYKKLESVENRLNINEQLLGVLVRHKVSDKGSKLIDIAKERGRVSVRQVMDFLNISRTHTLTLMRKVAKQPGYRFIEGNKAHHISSQLIFNENLIIQQQYHKIEDLLVKNDSLPLANIMSALSLTLPEAKLCAERFVESHPEFCVEGNKLMRAS